MERKGGFCLCYGGPVLVVEDRQRVRPTTDPDAQGLPFDRDDALQTGQRTLCPGVIVELLELLR